MQKYSLFVAYRVAAGNYTKKIIYLQLQAAEALIPNKHKKTSYPWQQKDKFYRHSFAAKFCIVFKLLTLCELDKSDVACMLWWALIAVARTF